MKNVCVAINWLNCGVKIGAIRLKAVVASVNVGGVAWVETVLVVVAGVVAAGVRRRVTVLI